MWLRGTRPRQHARRGRLSDTIRAALRDGDDLDGLAAEPRW